MTVCGPSFQGGPSFQDCCIARIDSDRAQIELLWEAHEVGHVISGPKEEADEQRHSIDCRRNVCGPDATDAGNCIAGSRYTVADIVLRGWSMALGIILGGIGAVMAWGEG